jgi:hypothetical protein
LATPNAARLDRVLGWVRRPWDWATAPAHDYPTVGDLVMLHGNPSAGADTLKQIYQWRQDEWGAVPQAAITAVLTLVASLILSSVKAEFQTSAVWVLGAAVIALATLLIAIGILFESKRQIGLEFMVAMEIFNSL